VRVGVGVRVRVRVRVSFSPERYASFSLMLSALLSSALPHLPPAGWPPSASHSRRFLRPVISATLLVRG